MKLSDKELSQMTVEDLAQEVTIMLIDGCRGIYAANSLAKQYGDTLQGISEEDLSVLVEGPDHDDYFYVSDDLQGISIKFDDGDVWSLNWRDGDIVAHDYDTIDRWESLVGENFWDQMP